MATREHNGEPADVLLVEDDPGDVRLTEEAFREGHITNELHVAEDGVEALDFVYRRGATTRTPPGRTSFRWTSTSARTATRYSRRCETMRTYTASRSAC